MPRLGGSRSPAAGAQLESEVTRMRRYREAPGNTAPTFPLFACFLAQCPIMMHHDKNMWNGPHDLHTLVMATRQHFM